MRHGGADLIGRAPKAALLGFVLFVCAAFFAPIVVPHDPIETNLAISNTPVFFMQGGRANYPLGTDRLGRDVLSRVIYGARVSLSVGIMAVLVAAVVGVPLGLLAAYRGGLIGALVAIAIDVSFAFPVIVLALVLGATVGASFWTVVGIIAFIFWSQYARLLRGQVLLLRELDFVTAARLVGCTGPRILRLHLLPNVVNILIVLTTLQLGWAILWEGFLSFLGAGIPPPVPSWGGMVAEGRTYIATLWWMSLFPGAAIMALVLSVNIIGDWLRDELDPTGKT